MSVLICYTVELEMIDGVTEKQREELQMEIEDLCRRKGDCVEDVFNIDNEEV